MTFRDLRHALRTGTAAAGGLAGYSLPSTALVFPPSRRLFGVRVTIPDQGAVALTFDDGPHPEGTPRILDLLRAADVPATFFLVGEQVERFPELARQIAADGHEVAVHCFQHVNLMRRGPRRTRDDLERTAEAIREATGAELRRYRPPYGILTLPALQHARREGWETILWRQDGRDWRADATPESIASRLLGKAQGGDVLLLHDADWYASPRSWERTAGALELVLERLRDRGLRVGTL
jgi:peptidoglycan/xylan/chitin deacetylase (PgdA/CDA1 family)